MWCFQRAQGSGDAQPKLIPVDFQTNNFHHVDREGRVLNGANLVESLGMNDHGGLSFLDVAMTSLTARIMPSRSAG